MAYGRTSGGVAKTVTGAQVTLTNKSGTITAGGTAQVLMAANADRLGYWVQNHSDTDMWVSDVGTAAAAQPSYKLAAGATWQPPATPVGAISIFCATTGKAFSAREW